MRKEKILEILENAKDGNGAVPMRLVRTAFDKLPEPCEDTISRQAAIDAFGLSEKTRKYGGDHSGYDTRMLYEIQDILEGLSSAQPEPQWIPVSERLPEEDDYKSCIECLDGAVWYFTEKGTMGIGYYYESTKEWSTTDDLKTDGKVIAWMPLPEAYKPNNE